MLITMEATGRIQLTQLFQANDSENDEEEEQEPISMFDFSKSYYDNEEDQRDKDVFLDIILRSGLELDESDETVKKANLSYKQPVVYPDLKEKSVLNLEMEANPEKYVRGIIRIEDGNLAFCEPLDGGDDIIIEGRSSAGQTFSDDEVIVEIIKEDNTKGKKKESDVEGLTTDYSNIEGKQRHEKDNDLLRMERSCRYGHVVSLESRTRFHDIKHPVFLCTMAMHGNMMNPMCKTVPKVYMMKTNVERRTGTDVYQYQSKRKSLRVHYCKEFSRKEILQNIFVVVVLNWDKRRQYPIGVVIDVLEFGKDEKSYQKLTDRLHGVPTIYSKDAIEETENMMKKPDDGCTEECLKVFTIDNKNSRCLDDAFSVQKLDKVRWRIGIHITDVASIIKKDSGLDKQARELVETQYQGRQTRKPPVHMLPEPLSTDRLSLILDKKRQTIGLFFLLEERENELKYNLEEMRVQNVVSKRQFSYLEVDDILVGEKREDDPYFMRLSILNTFSKYLKEKRLGAHADVSLHSDESEIYHADAHQSQSLVEELMIYTNYNIANILLKHYDDCVPIRVQNIPLKEKLDNWLVDHMYIKNIIFSLQNQIVSLDAVIPYESSSRNQCLGVLCSSNGIIPDKEMVRIRRDVWSKLVAASEAIDIEDNDVPTSYLESLLKDDRRYPYQCRAFLEFCKFQSRASYKCSANVNLNSPRGRHFSLAVHPYTHFTSPLRRYIDIVNHRLLHAAMKKQTKPYIKEEVHTLCEKANGKKRTLASYRNDVDNFTVVRQIYHSPKMFEAYISRFTQNSICLTIQDFYGKDIRRSELTLEIPYRLLQLANYPEEIRDQVEGSTAYKFSWDRKVYTGPGIEFPTTSAYLKSCRFIPIKEWRKMLKNLLIKDFDEARRMVLKWRDIFEDCDAGDDLMLSQVIRVNDDTRHYFFTSEEHDGDETFQLLKISLNLHLDQVVKLQVVSEINRGHQIPTPQYLSIEEHLCFCIEHNRDPVEIFCGYATLHTETFYDDVDDYILRWLPIIEMESVYGAVKEIGPITIHGMDYTIQEGSGQFTLPAEYCLYRGINLTSSNMEVINKIDHFSAHGSDDSVSSANYLCIRCDISDIKDSQKLNTQWIAHAKITRIKENLVKIDERSEVESYNVDFMILSSTGDGPKGDIKGGTIELIQKSIVERRQETIIKRHLEISPDLAFNVALGNCAPFLDEGFHMAAKYIGTDVPQSYFARNNEDQDRAIQIALTNSFSLIQGPPGTGKTVTGVKLLYLLHRLNRRVFPDRRQIVFCGPSNKSIDNVARILLERPIVESERWKELKIIRLYGKSFVYQDFPIPDQFNFLTPGKIMKKTDVTLKNSRVVLHHVIRKRGKQYADRLRAFDDRFIRSPDEVSASEFLEYEDIHSRAEQAELKEYDIIFCTVSMTSNPKLIKATKGRIQQCIIDECGMCTEPETLVPMIALQPEQVVLIGDHKQLQPIIKCKEAATMGLQRSLFERYHARSLQAPRTMLTLQYRMNPSICEFPSDAFYEGRLKTDNGNKTSWEVTSPLSIWKNSHSASHHVPLAFFHVEGIESTMVISTHKGNEQSKSNKAEIEFVMKIIEYFRRQKVSLDKINVMSQYNAQCSLLRDEIQKKNLSKLQVNTVVSSQGGEWDYVIFSTTRSLPRHLIQPNPTTDWRFRNLGFIVDTHQINVALTRARKGLILVGNQHLLKADRTWSNLINFYREKGCVYENDSILNQ